MPTVLIITVFGIYFTHRSGYLPIIGMGRVLRSTVFARFGKKQSGTSPFAAAMAAIGGTVGVGSIAGMGFAIATGGAGSIFWMWICSITGMGLKYAEVKTALGGGCGGTPYRLKALGKSRMSALFCVTCILSSFGTGNLTQQNAFSESAVSLGANRLIVALSGALLVGIAVFGGKRRIIRINSRLVPIASAVYLITLVLLMLLLRDGIANAFSQIFEGAFGIKQLASGTAGAMIARSVREGFARSVFSNEAGLGCSTLAHSESDGDSELQARWGIFEIFFDTFIISTPTAVVLLASGATDCTAVFQAAFGDFGKMLFALLTAVFAFASVISWCCYAEKCITCLGGKRNALIAYRILSVAVAFIGATVSKSVIWELADILNAILLIPNLFMLFLCRKEIYKTE